MSDETCRFNREHEDVERLIQVDPYDPEQMAWIVEQWQTRTGRNQHGTRHTTLHGLTYYDKVRTVEIVTVP